MPTITAVLRSLSDLAVVIPGRRYIVQAGDPAYFPTMALIRAGGANFLGESYSYGPRMVTLEVTHVPHLRMSSGALSGLAGPDDPTRRSITIGKEFFLTALKDYDDWKLKWWREVVQNAVDAKSSNVRMGAIANPDNTTTVYCDDDGIGMDTDTVLNKFLVLGASTKGAGTNTAGGFGKAKELLLLPWISWRIHTRDTLIEGAGIDYTVQSVRVRQGMRLEVVMPADNTTTEYHGTAFLEKSFIPQIRFTINGKLVEADLAPMTPISSIPGKVDLYFNPTKEKQSLLYVRTRGLYMFYRYIGEVPGYVLAELSGPSIELLTANRDGFRDYQVASEIDRLGVRIAKDNMSALKSKQGLIRQKFVGSGKFRARMAAADMLQQIGPSLGGHLSNDDSAKILSVFHEYTRTDESTGQATQLPPYDVAQAMLDQKFTGPNHIEAAIQQLVWEPDFYLMNDIEGFKVPRKFWPATMTPFVLKLAKTWVELCRFVLMQLGSTTKFGVGFIFSQSTAAAALEEEENKDGVAHWLMLNPYRKYERSGEGEIWRPTQHADLQWLYAAAIHEATHIADKIQYHDESFASALTYNIAKCADGYRKIRAIVGGLRMRGGVQADVDEP